MNPQSAAIVGSGNPLKSRFESEIRAKIFSKSADPFAYPPASLYKLQIRTVLKDTMNCAAILENITLAAFRETISSSIQIYLLVC